MVEAEEKKCSGLLYYCLPSIEPLPIEPIHRDTEPLLNV